MATVTNQSLPAPAPAPVEDEALKRNTDCVYFLASPLTCKKGVECEYRHSEYARVNPRDCWYWLNGNCLNPKCSFRHPPLDTLIGSQAGNFSGHALPVPPTSVVPLVSSAPQGAPKQRAPCIFFQKGYCLKGDVCPFMHGPAPLGNKVQQVPATMLHVNEPSNFKKAFGGLEKCTLTKSNIPKVVGAPPQAKTTPKVEAAIPVDRLPSRKRGTSPNGFIEEPPKYKETLGPNIDNGNSRTRSSRAHHSNLVDNQSYQNNARDVDDALRESSPGFDVLVDDKLRGDEYYQHEDQFMRMRGHDGRSMNEFEVGHRDDYNSVSDADAELYHNRSGYESFDRLPERYIREQRRVSSEKEYGQSAHNNRNLYHKSKSPDVIQNSDLRHRLSNTQRRVNGLKSVVNPDYDPDNHSEERGYRASRRDSRRLPQPRESSRGSCLEGRLKLPGRSVGGSDVYLDRENGRERNWGRSSPSRPTQVSSLQGRLRDRLSSRDQDEKNDGRGLIRGPVIGRNSFRDNGTNFSSPKSLSELKGKETDIKQQQSNGQQQSLSSGVQLRDRVLASSVRSESNYAFDGPKPLSEILKRKRGKPTSTSDKEDVKHIIDENIEGEIQINNEENINKPVDVGGDEGGEISNKKSKLVEVDSFVPKITENLHIEEGLVDEEQGLEVEYDQGDLEDEYEQDEEEGFNLNGVENAGHDEDFMDDEDGDDDFAKKLGVSI